MFRPFYGLRSRAELASAQQLPRVLFEDGPVAFVAEIRGLNRGDRVRIADWEGVIRTEDHALDADQIAQHADRGWRHHAGVVVKAAQVVAGRALGHGGAWVAADDVAPVETATLEG